MRTLRKKDDVITILVFLQNAWRAGGKDFTEEQWLTALWASHTGRRLRNMLPRNAEIAVANSTPIIGINSSSAYKADYAYMLMQIARFKPDTIVACGKVAQAGLDKLNVEYIAAPHPAWRAFPKELEMEIKTTLEAKSAEN